jgi:hypothetical protein
MADAVIEGSQRRKEFLNRTDESGGGGGGRRGDGPQTDVIRSRVRREEERPS